MPKFKPDDCYTEYQAPRERSKGVAVASVLSPAELARAEAWRKRWGATGQLHNRKPRRSYEVEPSREAVIEFQDRHVYDWLLWLRQRRAAGEDS